MSNPLIYPALGFSRETRRHALREKALRMADGLASRGLPTRLPFLKKVLCGIEAEPPPSSRPAGLPPQPIVVRLKPGLSRELSEATEQIARWNSATRDDGLQYVPIKRGRYEVYHYEQRRCDVALEGDLLIASVPDMDPTISLPNKAFYSDRLFQIFINPHEILYPKEFAPETLIEGPIRNIDAALVHEKEHAIHCTIWMITGLPPRLMPSAVQEYLAMLSATVNAGDDGLIGESRLLFWKRVIGPETMPYALAAKYFEYRMRLGYNLTPLILEGAMHAAMFPRRASELDFLCLEKIREYGKMEFDSAYRRLFGLDLQDIREVVSLL